MKLIKHWIFVSTLLMLANTAFAVEKLAKNADIPSLKPNKTLKWAGCGITKKAFMQELATAYERFYGVRIELEGGGATKGIRRVADLSADIGGSCRSKMPDHPLEFGVRMTPVAWDALVVIVNKDNPIESIGLDQLRKMYRGEVNNFSELGGSDQPLELMVRKGKNSGVGRMLRELVFANYKEEFKGDKTFPSTGPLEKAVEANINAIGVTGISSARKRDVKMLKLDGMDSSFENIRSGNYALYRPLYITYNPRSPEVREVKKFIRFAHSPYARNIIRHQGVVPYLDAINLTAKQREQRLNTTATGAAIN